MSHRLEGKDHRKVGRWTDTRLLYLLMYV